MKRIAVITMARNDEFFLNRWIDYYGVQIGEENLYIYLDGEDQSIPVHAKKANVIHQKRVAEHVVKAEKRRLGFLSEVANQLLHDRYDMVIGVDADEFLVVDPKMGKSLAEYLSSVKCNSSISGLGMDVGQNLNTEMTLDPNLPFLSQRKFAFLSPRYTKPSVITKPVSWGSGFHRIKGKNFKIDSHLYLFHFGSVDYEMIQQRFQDKDRMATGRKKHIMKRAKTIFMVTKKNAKNGDKFIPMARTIQTFCRPVFAWNKPSMGFFKWIINIPERFEKIGL